MTQSKLDATRLRIFSDFDGTITERDTLVFLAQHLGGGLQMCQAIGRLLREGKLTLREGIAGEMRSIRAPFSAAVELLREQVRLDPAFAPFARWCAARGIPLTILSGGFQQIIDLFISPEEFPGLEIRANTLQPDEKRGWQCVFRDQSPFGHDKARTLGEARRQGFYVVFIGDGFSDRAPAEVADEVFAKPDLAAYCRARDILCHEYRGFDEIWRQLRERVEGAEQGIA
jgi:2,3-diketo-5-methylthio-1-phosphopentane phosphatase